VIRVKAGAGSVKKNCQWGVACEAESGFGSEIVRAAQLAGSLGVFKGGMGLPSLISILDWRVVGLAD